MDIHVAVVWMLFSVVATCLCILGWVVLARTASKKNGVHALVASLLTSRVIFCLSVTSLCAIYVYLEANWSVLACHALYWLWTVTWVSDIIGACAGSVWGLVKLRHLQSSFRLGATIAVAGTWLLATTSAGILAYFNRRIKDKEMVQQAGCLVTPLVEETELATGVLCVLVVGVLTSVGLLVAFQVRLSRLQGGTTQGGPSASHISVDAQSVNGQIAEIRREPSHLETIEEYCVRPGTISRMGLDKEDAQRLRDWRNLFCTATALTLILNVTPHLVNLCFHILRHTYVPHGNVILLSCHLANSILFPITMVTISKEYRQALLMILKGRDTQNKDPRRSVDSLDNNAQNRHTEHDRSYQGDTNLKSNGHHKLSKAAFAETVTVTPDDRQETVTPDDRQSPQVARSASRLSRLEWKEQMMKSGTLAVGTHDTQADTELRVDRVPCEGHSAANGVEETESDAVSDAIGGGFHDSDIERVLCMPAHKMCSVPGPRADTGDDSSYDARSTSHQSSLERISVHKCMSGRVLRDESSSTHVIRDPERLWKPHRGLGRRKKKQKTKGERRTQDIYATISRALGLDDTNNIQSRPVSRSDMVYSQTNPFLKTLQEQEAEGDTESERSMEAEIVAIMIRGRGSFKKKLKRRGLLPGFTYVTNGGEVGMNQEDIRAPAVHHSPDERHQYSPRQGHTKDTGITPHLRPTSRSTNPFIDNIDETSSIPNTRRGIADSYTREWVTSKQQFPAYNPSPHHSNPFLNYGFQNGESEGLFNEESDKRWSSNPFLQDLVAEVAAVGPHNASAEFVTRSAPASPTLPHKTIMPAALAVTAVELMKSNSEMWVSDNTGQPAAFTNKAFTDSSAQVETYRTEYL